MSYRKYFKEIVTQLYPDQAINLLHETDKHYPQIAKDVAFSKKSSNPLDKRLDFAAYFLSLIQAMEKAGFEFDPIKKCCLEITYAYVRPKNKIHAWLKQLPAKLVHAKITQVLLKILDRKISRKGHADGFLAKLIMDKKQTYGLGYGIDILECGICVLFKKHGFEKYSSILCEVDKVTSDIAGLELIRKGTIANGAEKCDFRFKKK